MSKQSKELEQTSNNVFLDPEESDEENMGQEDACGLPSPTWTRPRRFSLSDMQQASPEGSISGEEDGGEPQGAAIQQMSCKIKRRRSYSLNEDSLLRDNQCDDAAKMKRYLAQVPRRKSISLPSNFVWEEDVTFLEDSVEVSTSGRSTTDVPKRPKSDHFEIYGDSPVSNLEMQLGLNQVQHEPPEQRRGDDGDAMPPGTSDSSDLADRSGQHGGLDDVRDQGYAGAREMGARSSGEGNEALQDPQAVQAFQEPQAVQPFQAPQTVPALQEPELVQPFQALVAVQPFHAPQAVQIFQAPQGVQPFQAPQAVQPFQPPQAVQPFQAPQAVPFQAPQAVPPVQVPQPVQPVEVPQAVQQVHAPEAALLSEVTEITPYEAIPEREPAIIFEAYKCCSCEEVDN